jgi:hypothetical protein
MVKADDTWVERLTAGVGMLHQPDLHRAPGCGENYRLALLELLAAHDLEVEQFLIPESAVLEVSNR